MRCDDLRRTGCCTAPQWRRIQFTEEYLSSGRGFCVRLDLIDRRICRTDCAGRRHGHTRYPLCEGSLDRLVGIVNIKDLLWKLREVGPNFDLRQIRRPVRFVPETKYIKGLLSEFRQTRTHIAVVVDEFGSTVGVVTLEDVLEEIVGEIQDEFDRAMPPEMVQAKGPASYLVHGRTLIDELNDALDVEIEDNDNDTVAGHVMTLLGRTARIGDEVEIAGLYKARVIGMKGLQITDLTLDAIDAETGAGPAPEGD